MKKLLFAAAALALAPGVAHAQAIIDNGTIRLGVDSLGQLNTTAGGGSLYGVYDLRTNHDGTRAGCLCEGWGVGIEGTSIAGYADNATGIGGLTLGSFTSTASSAISNVTVNGGDLSVTHNFHASASADLYQVDVTITNTGSATTIGNLLYRRLMDWDIEPTAFREYVTIAGSNGAANVKGVNDNGFSSANPLTSPNSPISVSGSPYTGDFKDSGPADHGALFDFSFDPLAAGASQSFSIFYGASLTERGALSALGTVGAEVYSLGQSTNDKDGGTDDYSTFTFGFKGVGGTALPDPTAAVPEPASWAMMMMGIGLAGGALRRRRRQQPALSLA